MPPCGKLKYADRPAFTDNLTDAVADIDIDIDHNALPVCRLNEHKTFHHLTLSSKAAPLTELNKLTKLFL